MKYFVKIEKTTKKIIGSIITTQETIGLPSDVYIIDITQYVNREEIIANPQKFKVNEQTGRIIPIENN